MTRRIILHLCAALCCLAIAALPVSSMAASAMELEAAMGYDGAVTYVRKLPVNVTLTNHGTDTNGKLVVDVNRSDREFDRYELPVSIAGGASMQLTVPVVLTQRQTEYTVSWMEGEEALAQTAVKPGTVINPSSLIVGTLSQDPQQLTYLNIGKGNDPLSRAEYWTTVPLDADVFPTDSESLRFFDILAIDGFDLSVLSDAQQQALEVWLKNGGIVLLGGGANASASFPYFSRYTGITAGALEDGGDFSQDLLEWFGLSAQPLGQDVRITPLNGTRGTPIGPEGLVDMTRIEDGLVFTAAFALGEKPLNSWLGKNAIWQRALLSCAGTHYRDIVDSRLNGSYNTSNIYVNTGVANLLGVENGAEMALPMVIIGLFIILAGFGSYLLLKKLDRQEWMWLSIPLLAVAASLVLWATSAALPLREPIAVHYTMLSVDEDGQTDGYTAVVAAKSSRDPMTVGVEEGTLDIPSTVYYYASNDMQEQEAAVKLRYTYGADETITFPETWSWGQNSLIVRDAALRDVSVLKGECGWDGESLVFTLTNGSDIALSEGIILTNYGFVSVPALLPGQTASAVMSPDPDASKNASRSRDEIVRDGVLLSEADLRNYSYYDFIDVYTNIDDENPSSDEMKARLVRRYMINDFYNRFDSNEDAFRYFAFSDELDALRLTIDGQTVTRTAQQGLVCVTLAYNPISSDGTARFLKGSFPSYTATVGESGRPVVGESLGQNLYQSFILSSKPAFAFDMSSLPQGLTLTSLDIAPRYSYYSYKTSLYNARTGEWDEFEFITVDRNGNTESTENALPDLDDYLSDGYLFVQFESHGNTESYADIYTPVMSLEGSVK